jgi:hypothetical protein
MSESHGDSNRCTPCMGNMINTPHTSHTQSMYGPRPYVSHVVHVYQPFMGRQQGWTDVLLPRKSAPDFAPHPDWVVHETRLSFSSNTTIESVRLSQAPVDGRLLGLLGPYHYHVISRFNTYSRGPTHRSLTDTGGGYNLGGASFPHHTSWPSKSIVLHFPPKGPARSQVIQSQHKPLMKVIWNTYHRSVIFWPLGINQSLYLRLAMANIFQILARSSWNI